MPARRKRKHTALLRSTDEIKATRHLDARGRPMPEGLLPTLEAHELHKHTARMREMGYSRSTFADLSEVDLDALDDELERLTHELEARKR